MMVVETLIIIISVCVLWVQTYMHDWKSVIFFLSIVSVCHYVLKMPVYFSFGVSGILSCLMNVTYCRTSVEQYSVKEKPITDDSDENEDENEDDAKEEVDDEVEDESNELDDGNKARHKNSNAKTGEKALENNPIDMNATIQDALEKFDPSTLKNMTKDTTSLIKSQTELMNIIEQMQPVISKGLSLVDKFNNGKTEDLFKKYHDLSKISKTISN